MGSSTHRIVGCAIHPSIGVARVGNSPDEYFLGPETPGMTPEGPFKDKHRRIKRQAARFRIYGYDEAGGVRELTLDDSGVSIEWTVHVANTKAAWYQFNNSMDLPDGLSMTAQQRNKNVLGTGRDDLIIDPGAQAIQGRSQQSGLLTGRFMGEAVPLGQLRTDDSGRLLFLGGFGKSDSPSPSNPIVNFSNNDAWHDDVCDGPVRARVRVNGREVPVKPAWVFSAPPKYAPGIMPITTLWDLLRDVAVRAGWMKMPATPSFAHDILPILQRLSMLQWVDSAQDLLTGWKSELDFLDPDLLRVLADCGPSAKPERERIFGLFRNPSFEKDEPDKLPVAMGDGIDYPGSPRRWFALLGSQYEMLRLWSEGHFTSDGEPEARPEPLDRIPAGQQPAMLDRAALEPCLGGPFHPGIELTWPMRHRRLYSEPFRLKQKPEGAPLREDFGLLLSPEKALAPDGPLGPSGPGDLTRWMGCPWQSDAASCQDIYVPQDFPLPTWWPAVLPIDVLPEFAYRQVLDPRLRREQREKFLGFRRDWSRGVGDVGYHAAGGYAEAMVHMVDDWKRLGVVVELPGPSDAAETGLPKSIFVETEREELEA